MSKAAELAALIGSGQAQGNKNLIINGAMQVAQRGTSETGVNSTQYANGPDRWKVAINHGTFTISQSTTAPAGFATSYKFDCTTADTSLAADAQINLQQSIEGLNVQSIKKGTSDAKPVTVSFHVRSNKTGTYICSLFDEDNIRRVAKTYTIDSANTWERKTITFPADTTGALNNDTGIGLYVQWYIAAGSNYTSGTLATTWESQTVANICPGLTVNMADSTDNEWYITGVQLEIGEQATPFEHRSFGDELARCQRYYYFHGQGTGSNSGDIGIGSYYDSVSLDVVVQFPVTMRATPTVDATSGTDYYVSFRNSGADRFNSFILNKGSPSAVAIGNSSEASGTGGQATLIRYENASARVAFDSEL
mgnify:CR=1 FL=1